MKLRSSSKRKRKRTVERHEESDDEKVSLPASSQDGPQNAVLSSQDDNSDNHGYRSHIIIISSDSEQEPESETLTENSVSCSEDHSDMEDFIDDDDSDVSLPEWKKILKDLRNDNSLSIDDYLDVSRIFIMNIINPKTMTRLRTSTDSEFNGERTFRHALRKLTKTQEEAAANCQTGAWQPLLKSRLKLHPNMEKSSISPYEQKCGLCGRQRMCKDVVVLSGFMFNETTLLCNETTPELTDEERNKGLLSHSGKDGSNGIQTVVGPLCIQRLEVFHEITHYKYSFYMELKTEVQRQLKNNAKYASASGVTRRKRSKADSELRLLAENVLSRLKDVFIQMSYNNLQELTTRARNMEEQVGYYFERHNERSPGRRFDDSFSSAPTTCSTLVAGADREPVVTDEKICDVEFEFLGRKRINDADTAYLSNALAVDVNQQTLAVCAEEPRNFKNTTLSGDRKFGVYLVNLANRREGHYIAVHEQPVRAMDFGCGFLLTGAEDKTIQCLDYENEKTMHVFQCQVPVWSVAWNRAKSLAYGGLGNGVIAEFDIRIKSKDPTRTLKSGLDEPIEYLKLKNNGLLIGQSKAISWTPFDNKSVVNVFAGQTDQLGPCVSVHESQNTIVTTFRGIEFLPPKTIVAKLQFGYDGKNRTVKAKDISEFIAGEKNEVMTRDRVLMINGSPIVACSNQSDKSMKLFTPKGLLGERSLIEKFNYFAPVRTLKQSDKPPVDLVQYQHDDQTWLAELDGKFVNFYRLKL